MFNLSRLRFELELLDDNAPLGFWGTRLRGGYGDVLKKHLCYYPKYSKCQDCELFQDRSCLFPYLFKPHSHLFPDLPKSEPLKKSVNLPAPFVIDAPIEVDTKLKKGSRIGFEFSGFGKTIENYLYVLEGFGKLGEVGLDIKSNFGNIVKSRYQLLDVQDLFAFGRSLHVRGNINKPSFKNANELISVLRPQNIPKEIVIEFITPVRILRPEYPPLAELKYSKQKEIARSLRDFYDLIFILTNRIGATWQLYGENWVGQAEYYRWRNALLKASKNIQILEIELHKKSYLRFAKDQKKSVAMDGFIGAIRVKGDFTDLIDILLLGEILHIGESTAFGFGQYKLIF
jgi:hypothetical protein